MITVLVVGQMPPPFHGQSIMIAEMLKMRDPRIRFAHVRMDFSAEIGEVGRLMPKKFLRLAGVIAGIYAAWFRHRPDVLYYPPAGPNAIPMLRDIAILIATRWLFPKTVFHFHAGGLSQLYPSLPFWLKPFFKLAYSRPDVSIRLSELNPEDGKALDARIEHVIPCGIPDLRPVPGIPSATAAGPLGPVGILFVGILCESKGVTVLLDACGELAAQGADFRVEIMGRFENPDFERATLEQVERRGLKDRVRFLGVLVGSEKVAAFSRAGIFCFPSFYESETFGLVLLEAMCFSLPIVTTRWRGIPSVVTDGENGFLAPINDSAAVAESLLRLLADSELRTAMGARGRARFESDFGIEIYHGRMARVFLDV
jgi:glycosyltransferase involved in cell wall biosynthesis